MCDKCGYIGKSQPKYKSFKAKIISEVSWFQQKPPRWPACARCESFEFKWMIEPEVRDVYFEKLEAEKPSGADVTLR